MSDNLRRVRDKTTGHEYTTGAFDPELHEPTGKKATDDFGRPLPSVPYTAPAPAEEDKKDDKGPKPIKSV